MNEFYEGQQFVGMDLHRRRSVLVRMTEAGEHLGGRPGLLPHGCSGAGLAAA